MDIAQAVHVQILKSSGCPLPSESLSCDDVLPGGDTLEGAYADDHLIIQKCSFKELADDAPLRDDEIIDSSVRGYERAGAECSLPKRTRKH